MSTPRLPKEEHPTIQETSQLVRQLRSAVGDTQQQFANRIGAAISSVVRYEAGKPVSEQAFVKMVRLAREIGRQDLATGLADNYWQSHMDPSSYSPPTWQKAILSLFEKISPSRPDLDEINFLLQQTTMQQESEQGYESLHQLIDEFEQLGDFVEGVHGRLKELQGRLTATGASSSIVSELAAIIEDFEKKLKELEGPEEANSK